MDTEALVIGVPLELSWTWTEAPVLKLGGTNPGGTAPVGKLISEARMKGAALEGFPEIAPPPPPLPQAASRHAAATLVRAPTLLWDSINSLPGRSRLVDNALGEARRHRCREDGTQTLSTLLPRRG